MPVLKSLLNDHDLDFLTRIAHAWRVEVSPRDHASALTDLVVGMLNMHNLEGMLSRLDEPGRQAWNELQSSGGHIPWVIFTRKYGELRSIGPARREREAPDLNPASTTERLWYTGLIGRAFLKIGPDTEEYAYVPDELLSSNRGGQAEVCLSLRPAADQSPAKVRKAGSYLLDHLTDLLAAARMQQEVPQEIFAAWGIPRDFLNTLFRLTSLLDAGGQPDAEALRSFFQQTRSQALFTLYRLWRDASEVNDLAMLPGLTCEGAWRNDPLAPRRMLTSILVDLEGNGWWSISSLLAGIKHKTPDFQRPAGDYDSWFIRDAQSGEYLRGFECWDQVEGALLVYLLSGPLHWFGLLNLANDPVSGEVNAFQLTLAGRDMLHDREPSINNDETTEILVKGSSNLVFPSRCSRLQRYQAGRFCELISASQTDTTGRISPASLKRAAEQGLTIAHLVQLLEKERKKPLPMAFKRLAERWQTYGLEAEVSKVLLLRFFNEETCAEFMGLPSASRLVLERLNGITVLIQQKQVGAVQKALAEMGILAQIAADV